MGNYACCIQYLLLHIQAHSRETRPVTDATKGYPERWLHPGLCPGVRGKKDFCASAPGNSKTSSAQGPWGPGDQS